MPRVLEMQLSCPVCGKTREVPGCHGKAMEFDGTVLFCPTCHKELELPGCCGSPMSLTKKLRDIKKELFRKP